MIEELEQSGFLKNAYIIDGVRDPSDAHRFSTAYSIIHDVVSLEAIENTPEDRDRNAWWPPNIPKICIPHENTALRELLITLIRYNASSLSPETQTNDLVCTSYGCVRDVSFALEGYPRGDVRRLPNTDSLDVTKHVTGLAVDVGGWKCAVFGRFFCVDEWDRRVDEIAGEFRLFRPFYPGNPRDFPPESWHFERQ